MRACSAQQPLKQVEPMREDLVAPCQRSELGSQVVARPWFWPIVVPFFLGLGLVRSRSKLLAASILENGATWSSSK